MESAGRNISMLRTPPPARWFDVLREQFEFLLTHRPTVDCTKGCEACARLNEITPALVRPFEQKRSFLEWQRNPRASRKSA